MTPHGAWHRTYARTVPVLCHGAGTGGLGQVGFVDVGASVAGTSGTCGQRAGKELFMTLSSLPKVELHLHLEGAAPPAFIRGLAQAEKGDIGGIVR